jgi:hypothetical protein
MLVRLGNVLYWAGCIFAVFIAGAGLYVWNVEPNARKEPFVFIVLMGGLAGMGCVIGWACRYVLAGPQPRSYEATAKPVQPNAIDR